MSRALGLQTIGYPVRRGPSRNPLYNGLAAWWTLTAGPADAFGGQTLTNNNGVTFDANGAHFAAASQQSLSHVSDAVLQAGSGGWTAALEINFATLAGMECFSKDDSTAGNREFCVGYLAAAGNGWYFSIFDSSGGRTDCISGDTSPVTGTVYHLVAAYDPVAKSMTLWKNGVQIKQVTGVTTVQNNAAAVFYLGRRGYVGAEDYFTGALRKVGFWHRPFTQSDVTQLYNGGNVLVYPF